MSKGKNQAAVALAKLRLASMSPEEHQEVARKGGLVGGRARADKLSPKRRKDIARKAAQARWKGRSQ
jgi:general stress protein YciG